MNERIKELLNKCNYTIDGTCDLSREEKFAELIIKECIKQVTKHISPVADEGFAEGWNMGLEHGARQIELHFGVQDE